MGEGKVSIIFLISILFLSTILSFYPITQITSASSISDGLVGYWKLDEGSGTEAFDSSGNDNTGTLVDSPIWTDGKYEKALEFNGYNGYVIVSDSPSLRVQSFTLSAWVYLPVRPYQTGHIPSHPHDCIINKMYYKPPVVTGYKMDFEIPNASDDTLVLSIGDGSAQRFLVQYNSINDLTLNQWHLVTGTYDGSVAKIYIDGQLKASNIVHYSIVHDNVPLCLNREISQPHYDGVQGKIDEAMVYNRALSSEEIVELYEGNIPGVSKPSLEVSCESTTSYSGFKVQIEGKLSNNSAPIQDQPILLSYSVTGGNTWQELTYTSTNSNGEFSAEWRPTVTGNYLVKAVFEGNQDYSQTSEIVSLAVTSYQEQNMFSVSSNSTINNLFFNSTNKELSFSVSGDSGTTGYANVYIAKSLINDASGISVYLDGEKLDSSVVATEDSWILSFNYAHSSHTVTVKLANSSFFGIGALGDWLIPIIAIIIIVVVAIAVAVVVKKKKS